MFIPLIMASQLQYLLLSCLSSCPREHQRRMGHGYGFRGVFSWPFIGVNSPGLAEAPITRGGCPAVLVSQKGINSLHTMCCLHKGFFVTGEKGQLTPPASQ